MAKIPLWGFLKAGIAFEVINLIISIPFFIAYMVVAAINIWLFLLLLIPMVIIGLLVTGAIVRFVAKWAF